MNNKGQSLVLFLCLLPLILLVFVLVIDTSLFVYTKNKYISVTKTIIYSSLDTNEKDDIIKLYNDNKVEYDNLDIIISDGIEIKLDKTYKTLFLNKEFDIKIDIYGYKDNDKIKFKKGN